MSLKVYNTYKLRRASYLWPLVTTIREKATANVRQVLKETYVNMAVALDANDPDLVTKRDEWNLDRFPEGSPARYFSPEVREYRVRLMVARDHLQKGYRTSAQTSMLTGFDYDVSVGFRELRGAIFVTTFSNPPMRNVLNFLARDGRVRDYHYQNQTDRPRHIPAREWNERKKVWNEMSMTGKESDLLVLEICTFSQLCMIDPYPDLVKTYMKKAKLGSHRPSPV